MAQASRFVGDAPMVAHNASFDQRFWAAELERLGCDSSPANRHAPYACTMLLSRRLYPETRSFRLGSLAAFHDLPSAGRAHRAMADAEVAASLLARIQRDLERRYDVFDCQHELLVKVGKRQKRRCRRRSASTSRACRRRQRHWRSRLKPAMTDILSRPRSRATRTRGRCRNRSPMRVASCGRPGSSCVSRCESIHQRFAADVLRHLPGGGLVDPHERRLDDQA